MYEIKAIETVYKGCKFRSRLEARWAVFFDALDIKWQYEPEGFESTYDEDKVYRYLPDFFLPRPHAVDGSGTYVEVKGDPTALQRQSEILCQVHDFGGMLPGFAYSMGTTRGLILLGEIPFLATNMCFHPIIQHHKGLVKSWVIFKPDSYHHFDVVNDGTLACLLELSSDCDMYDHEFWSVESKTMQLPNYYPNVARAYATARSARFEHGEK